MIRRLNILREKVMNPNNQISLYLASIPFTILQSLEKFTFHGIRELLISFRSTLTVNDRAVNDFDFSIFNNISKVVLRNFQEIRIIRGVFQNIVELEIYSCGHLVEIQGPFPSSLKRLLIRNCHVLERIPPVDHIETVVLDSIRCSDLSFDMTFPSLPRSRSFTYTQDRFAPIHPKLAQTFLSLPCLHQLYELSLHISFPPEGTDFSVFCSIPRLSLLQSKDDHSRQDFQTDPQSFFQFPGQFTGHYLRLQCFNLIRWNSLVEDAFPNLTELSLEKCTELTHTPRVLRLKKLRLVDVSSLVSIASYEYCSELSVYNCRDLHGIDRQPRLEKLTVYHCGNLADLSAFDGQLLSSASFKGSMKFKEFGPFRNTKRLVIEDSSSSYLDFDGFHLTALPHDARRVTISKVKSRLHFEELGNVGYLYLNDLPQLRFGNGIFNIGHLWITRCHSLGTLRKVRNVTKSLRLEKCRKFSGPSLEVENIPVIRLENIYLDAEEMRDFSRYPVLGCNRLVELCRAQFLQRQAIAYATRWKNLSVTPSDDRKNRGDQSEDSQSEGEEGRVTGAGENDKEDFWAEKYREMFDTVEHCRIYLDSREMEELMPSSSDEEDQDEHDNIPRTDSKQGKEEVGEEEDSLLLEEKKKWRQEHPDYLVRDGIKYWREDERRHVSLADWDAGSSHDSDSDSDSDSSDFESYYSLKEYSYVATLW